MSSSPAYRVPVVPWVGPRPASGPLPPWVRPACFVGSSRPILVTMTIIAQRPPLPAGVDFTGCGSLGFNAHKYVASNPAIRLDVLPAAVPGAWAHGRGGIDDDLRAEK